LSNESVKDQDDGCIWIHPADPHRSCLITSDKSANHVFVYDLSGQLLQSLEVLKPGNIDLRQRVLLDGQQRDIVVVNQRSGGTQLRAFSINPETRLLTAIDGGRIPTGPNYGGCLYHSQKSGRLYFICTSEAGTVEQHLLQGNGEGGLTGQLVRSWPLGKCEGAVADDAAGMVYIAEEQGGIWSFPAEPDQPATPTLMARVGQQGLTGDLEGLTIVRRPGTIPWLIVSDQGRSRFVVMELAAPYPVVGEFSIEGVRATDGIDATTHPLGPAFPEGLFLCHSDRSPCPILVTSWREIADRLSRKQP
jgi:3-phytase